MAILRQNIASKEAELNSLKQEKIKKIEQQNKEQTEREKQLSTEVRVLNG